MLPKGLPRNPRELPVSSGPEYWSGGTQSPRVDQRGHGRVGEQSYHSTGEGGEPQGSRKGRPRNPPEGRGKQTYASAERRHNRDSELGSLCAQTSTE